MFRPLVAPRAPLRPRFIRELAVVPLEDEIVLDGAHQRHVLRGALATRMLPRLLALMDGRRTVPDLQRAMSGIAPEHVEAAVASLFREGLLEDGDEALGESANVETLAFFRRFAPATAANADGRDAYRKLAGTEVVVVDCDPDARSAVMLAELLGATGALHARRVGRQELETVLSAPPPPPAIGRLVVSFASHGEDRAWHGALHDLCAATGAAWFRAVLDETERYADIGPWFRSSDGTCYDCLIDVHGRTVDARPRTAAHLDFWTSLVAAEVVSAVSQIAPPMSGRVFRRHALDDWTATDLLVPKRMGCARCRPGTRREPGYDLETALVFEDSIALEAAPATSLRATSPGDPVATTLTLQTKSLAVCEQRLLPPEMLPIGTGVADALSDDSALPTSLLTVEQLSTCLRSTGGMRELRTRTTRRWAATAGNLGSVELFVAVHRVQGLAPGLYFYQPREHALAVLRRRRGGLAVDELMRRAVAHIGSELPDAVVFLTAAFHRVHRKYGSFGYRLIQLDAGAALGQLHLVARGLGLWSRPAPAWADDVVEEQLGLDTPHEQSTAAVLLSSRPLELHSAVRSESPGRPPSLQSAAAFHGMPVSDIVGRVYRESRRREDELARGPFPVPAELRNEGGQQAGAAIALPAPTSGGLALGEVLSQRTSVREYSPASVTREHLASMFHAAHRRDVNEWPDEKAAGGSLRFLLLARRVADVPPGLHVYDSEAHALRFLGPSPRAEATEGLLIQSELAAAPAQIWITGNLGVACARYGAWGHRRLLLRAGAAAHRLWFAAMSSGLAGTIVAGLVAGAARTQLGLDGYRRAALVALVFGHPVRS